MASPPHEKEIRPDPTPGRSPNNSQIWVGSRLFRPRVGTVLYSAGSPDERPLCKLLGVEILSVYHGEM